MSDLSGLVFLGGGRRVAFKLAPTSSVTNKAAVNMLDT